MSEVIVEAIVVAAITAVASAVATTLATKAQIDDLKHRISRIEAYLDGLLKGMLHK